MANHGVYCIFNVVGKCLELQLQMATAYHSQFASEYFGVPYSSFVHIYGTISCTRKTRTIFARARNTFSSASATYEKNANVLRIVVFPKWGVRPLRRWPPAYPPPLTIIVYRMRDLILGERRAFRGVSTTKILRRH